MKFEQMSISSQFSYVIKHFKLNNCQKPYEHYLKYTAESYYTECNWLTKYKFSLYLNSFGYKMTDEKQDFSNILPLDDVQQP